jgi:ABC-2 type transport system permease protein
MTRPRAEFSLPRYYRAGMRIEFQRELQYRVRFFLMLLGFMIEPTIYLVVWTSVADAQGGEIAGLTTGTLAAYYIVWTLVRVFNLGVNPEAWEWRIRKGRLNEFLSQPIHPFHRDFAFFAGAKFIWTVAWIPVAVFLSLIFDPVFEWAIVNVIGFAIAIWGGFTVRFVMLYALGMVNFWTTRGTAIFGIFVASELILSGRLVPLELMPEWIGDVAVWLPFIWTFQFPIDTLIGRLDPIEIVSGIALQVLWSLGLGLIFVLVWKRAIRRYGAVGN